MSVWQIIEQHILEIFIAIIGSLLAFLLIRYWSKFCFYLSKIIGFIKSKIPKWDEEMTKEELKQIANELRGLNEKIGDIFKQGEKFDVFEKKVTSEIKGVTKDISDKIKDVKEETERKIENVQKEIEEKFKAEIKGLTAEEKEKLSVSCVPKFKDYYPPSVEFNFEIDNNLGQSFILDRLFYDVSAKASKIGSSKIKICNDVYIDKRVTITGNNKIQVSKISEVSPIRCDTINESISKDGKEYDIEWEIIIEMFFEGDGGLKILSDTITPLSSYRDWVQWYKVMKEQENEYWEKWYKEMKGKEKRTIVS